MTGHLPQFDRRAFLRGLALLAAALPLQELGRVLASDTGTESEWPNGCKRSASTKG